MLKRIIPLMGLVGLLAMVLVACGGDDEDTAAPAASSSSSSAAAAPEPTATAPAVDEPIDINFLSSWPITLDSAAYFFTEIFPALIEEESGGSITVSYGGGPEEVPPFEQAPAIEADIYDGLLTAPGYHGAVPALGGAYDIAYGPYEDLVECGVKDAVSENYQRLLGARLWPERLGVGAATLLNKQITTASMKGLNVRGWPSVQAFITELDGNFVALSQGDLYTALDRGVVDGAMVGGGLQAPRHFGYHELLSHVIKPYLGETTVIIMVRDEIYDSMSTNQQEAWERAFTRFQPLTRAENARRDDVHLSVMNDISPISESFLEGAEKDKWLKVWWDAFSTKELIGVDPERGPGMVAMAKCVFDRNN
jgi:TRAP-type mannitol/chloroaromatic compound transport system substrate-binding protein